MRDLYAFCPRCGFKVWPAERHDPDVDPSGFALAGSCAVVDVSTGAVVGRCGRPAAASGYVGDEPGDPESPPPCPRCGRPCHPVAVPFDGTDPSWVWGHDCRLDG